MSDEKNLGDDLNDMLDDAKDGAKKAADTVSEKAGEFAGEAKDSASDFAKGANEVLGAENKKVIVGILAILFGAFGVHKFMLGYNKEGGILLGIFLVSMVLSCLGVGLLFVWIPGVIGLVEGIIYLTKSDEEFYNTYQVGKKAWF